MHESELLTHNVYELHELGHFIALIKYHGLYLSEAIIE